LAKAGARLELAMQWHNTGSAPCYRPYRLAYRLTGPNGYRGITAGPIKVSGWMPGTVELFTKEFFAAAPDLPPGPVVRVADAIPLAGDLVPGVYDLAVGVIADDPPRPVVRLGIQGRDAEGWYPLSRFKVVK